MKGIIVLITIFCLAACGKNSSPEGRMTSKIEILNSDLAAVREQNKAILDSLSKLNDKITELQRNIKR